MLNKAAEQGRVAALNCSSTALGNSPWNTNVKSRDRQVALGDQEPRSFNIRLRRDVDTKRLRNPAYEKGEVNSCGPQSSHDLLGRAVALAFAEAGPAEGEIRPQLGLGSIDDPPPRLAIGEADDESVAGRMLIASSAKGRVLAKLG
jgi:hypothetical protein